MCDGRTRKRINVTAEQRLQQLNDYVHLNPVRAKLLGKRDRIASINSFRWVGPEYYGEKRRESAEAKAERIVGEELKRLRRTEQTREQRPKGDTKKVAVAERVRQETTMTAA